MAVARFCRQCSIDLFGEDYRELAGIISKEQWKRGEVASVLCEGCGSIQVDPDGNCISPDCENNHRKCPGCGSIGFPVSELGPLRCTFCDGTEGGQGPKD